MLIAEQLVEIGGDVDDRAAALFEKVALGAELEEFLTVLAYDELPSRQRPSTQLRRR